MCHVRTTDGQDRSRSAASDIGHAAVRLALVALTLFPASRVDAQAARAGVGRSSLRITATSSVPVRLKAEQVGAAVVADRGEHFTTVDVPVRVAANMQWTLKMSATRASDSLQVQDAHGAWVRLEPSRRVSVLHRRAATNPQTFTVRVRLPAGASFAQLGGIRLLLTPAGT